MRWPLWRVAVLERSMEPAVHPGDWLLVWRGTGAGRRWRRCRSSEWRPHARPWQPRTNCWISPATRRARSTRSRGSGGSRSVDSGLPR